MLLIFASISYVLPFYNPTFWPLLWLFSDFLFHALYTKKFSIKTIIVWSVITIFLQLLPLCNALLKMAYGTILLKVMPLALLILYVSLYVILWLWTTQKIIKKLNLFWALTAWTVSLWLYFLFIEYAALWPFGKIEGYLFMNPLLPMSIAPQSLSPLFYVPLPIMLLWVCIINSAGYIAWQKKNPLNLLVFFFIVAPWIVISMHHQESYPPEWIKKVGHLPISFPASINLESGQRLLFHEMSKLHKRNLSISALFLPESSWNNATLSNTTQLDRLVGHPIKHLIVGSFFQKKKKFHNSLYWFQNGYFKQRFDKKHAVPLAERITLHADSWCTQLYFQKSPPICPSLKPRQSIALAGIATLIPYICSDLYCRNSPDNQSDSIILAISNDSWFMPHFQKLMALAARFRGIQWQRAVLYISFHYAQYFDQFGKGYKIATTPSKRLID